MTANKRKRGRPPKPVSEKLPQFSVRISAVARLGLHVLARSRGSTLNQAIEFAVRSTMNNQSVDGETITNIVCSAKTEDGKRAAGFEDQERWAAEVLAAPGGLSVFLPDSLRSPEERYLSWCIALAGENGDYVDNAEFIEFAREGFKSGVDQGEVVAQWKELEDEMRR